MPNVQIKSTVPNVKSSGAGLIASESSVTYDQSDILYDSTTTLYGDDVITLDVFTLHIGIKNTVPNVK